MTRLGEWILALILAPIVLLLWVLGFLFLAGEFAFRALGGRFPQRP